jgi:copper chaperone CopZ
MTVSFKVDVIFCYECVIALKKFIGSLKGVESVEVEEGRITIDFNSSTISEEEISRVAKDSVEKLGYKILD